MEAPEDNSTERGPDTGFSLVELLVVLVILGILAAVVVFAVRRVVGDSNATVCESDKQAVGQAVEAWFAKNPSDTVPATGIGPDRYEQTLVEAGLIRAASTNLDMSHDGSLIPAAGSHC